MRTQGLSALIAGLVILASCRADAEKTQKVPDQLGKLVKLERIAKLSKPVIVTQAPGDRSRLFVVEKDGKIRILRGGKVEPAPFIDLTDQVTHSDREQGLLGLAFHPKFAENGRFYVNYTDTDDNSRIVEFKVAKDDPNRADPRTRRQLLHVEQNGWNHNGGNLVFGPDGRLWVGFGDGGGAGDQDNKAQDPDEYLGKMVVIDVESGKAQKHMTGLRNPWRYSFDRKTGDLYIGDVGQNTWEEVDVVGAKDAQAGKQNFGWSIVEGLGHCFKPASGCQQNGLTQPVIEHSIKKDGWCSVIGGYVYRGKAIPELDGIYFYADFCNGAVRSLRWKDGKISDTWDWRDTLDPEHKLAALDTWGEDNDGELYLVSHDGPIYKLVRR